MCVCVCVCVSLSTRCPEPHAFVSTATFHIKHPCYYCAIHAKDVPVSSVEHSIHDCFQVCNDCLSRNHRKCAHFCTQAEGRHASVMVARAQMLQPPRRTWDTIEAWLLARRCEGSSEGGKKVLEQTSSPVHARPRCCADGCISASGGQYDSQHNQHHRHHFTHSHDPPHCSTAFEERDKLCSHSVGSRFGVVLDTSLLVMPSANTSHAAQARSIDQVCANCKAQIVQIPAHFDLSFFFLACKLVHSSTKNMNLTALT